MNTIESIDKTMPGFGEHLQPVNDVRYCLAKKISKIALTVLAIGVVGAITIALLPIKIPVLLTGLGVSILAVVAMASVIHYKRCRSAHFGISNSTANGTKQVIALGKSDQCEALACSDTVESYEWKKRLIKSAEHNIVLSGNYCGGETFIEILDLVEEQLSKKPNLKAVFISSDRFIEKKHHQKILELSQKFKDRFQLVETQEVLQFNPGIKRVSNHSKVLAIDYGKYFIQGGSGLEDKYAKAKGVGDFIPKSDKKTVFYLPKAGFRDQDFVFHSENENSVGRRVYLETLKLALRWQRLNDAPGYFENDQLRSVKKHKDLIDELLSEEMKNEASQVKPATYIQEFHASSSKDCSTKILCTGPEHVKNRFEQELIKSFREAKDSITISHLYFHPSKVVMQELIAAGKRGVKIKIITNGNGKNCPFLHHFFAPRNRYHYSQIVNALEEKLKKNVEVYEYAVDMTTFHKKVIVVDDTVIAGSSNFGYKSLVTMSDHEINFVTKSKEFADRTLKILETDIDKNGDLKNKGKARKIKDFKVSVSTKLMTSLHKMVAPLCG